MLALRCPPGYSTLNAILEAGDAPNAAESVDVVGGLAAGLSGGFAVVATRPGARLANVGPDTFRDPGLLPRFYHQLRQPLTGCLEVLEDVRRRNVNNKLAHLVEKAEAACAGAECVSPACLCGAAPRAGCK